ncbi:MAG: asparagine synthase (glutamine-hydrolyzing) [Alphaproteobacteria bacterium]|nr:asparagine synthase (glutamine-hydrolyzing) [Alphaproteobacteria bacterium]
MCGLAGLSSATPTLLDEMVERLAHRGPDGHGTWIDSGTGFGLAHTRLAIIDLSPTGHQPMVSPCGRYVIAFNGEIYNHRELRTELERSGECFHSTSDTEVLLRLLMRHGKEALSKLVGMFALALWDKQSQELLLARDALGIKPLLYAPLPGGGLAFASELLALVHVPGVGTAIDREALSAYLACLYVPAPRTIYSGIKKLEPGQWLTWRLGSSPAVVSWWRPCFGALTAVRSVDEAREHLMPYLRRAVQSAMISDVEVGCFLSGGIDSGVIAALMAETTKANQAPSPRSFTMTFDSDLYDEREAAAATARFVGTRHQELPAVPRVADSLPALIRAFGEPFGNPTAMLVYELSRRARSEVSVALVGDGGDEVFAGYPRHQGALLAERTLGFMPEKLRKGLAGLIPESQSGWHTLRRAREFLSAPSDPAERYASWVEYFSPQERMDLLGLDHEPLRPIAEIYRNAGVGHTLDAVQQTDLISFLPGNLLAYGDAMSMAHALELRLPLLDQRLVDEVGKIPAAIRFANGKKTLLKACAESLLPQEVIRRPKLGFNPPMGLWLKNELRGLVRTYITPDHMARLGIRWEPVRLLLHDRYRDNSLKIWALLVLAAWQETFDR